MNLLISEQVLEPLCQDHVLDFRHFPTGKSEMKGFFFLELQVYCSLFFSARRSKFSHYRCILAEKLILFVYKIKLV